MATSFEDFRSSLLSADARQGLGIHLTDEEAQQVHADPQASRSWYDYWLTISQPAPPIAAADDAPFAGADAGAAGGAGAGAGAAAVPLGGHDFAHTGAPGPAPTGFGGTPGAFPETAAYGAPAPGAPEKKKRTGLWVTLSIVGALLLIAIIVIVLAVTTARHWTKTDVPEKPETFHSEEYETGLYLVADDGISPCVVDQDWTDCIGAMEAQYAGACAGVELVPSAATLCAQHRSEIDRMIAEDAEGSFVASLGDFGHLTKTPEMATRQVSNDDYEPAVTHEAVCYFGFLGECE